MTALALLLLASWAWYLAKARHQKALRQREARIAELQRQVEALDAALRQNASGEAWADAVRRELGLATQPPGFVN